MTTKLIIQTSAINPTQILLHKIEKFIKWHHQDLKFYIAGGAVLKAFNLEPMTTSDIDVFFATHDDYLKACELFEQSVKTHSHHKNCRLFKFGFGDESPFTKSEATNANIIGKVDGEFVPKDHIPVQAISGTFWKNPEDLLDHFDMTVCQMIYSEGKYMMTEAAYNDNITKTLRFGEQSNIHQFKHRRLLKYLKRGYSPDLAMFKQLFVDNDSLYVGDFNVTDSSDDYDL
jgi:hypothetical protein